jgi:hypothetical protein
MTDAVGGSLWKVGVDTSDVEKGLSSTASKSQAMGKQVGGTFDTLKGKIGGLATSLKAPQISSGLLQGVGLGAGLIAFNAVGTAISSVVSFMGDAVQAAKEDQLSIDHLTTSLNANVPGWKTSQGAIDDFITSGQKLAFTDDDIRSSISQLVARTHDVKQAMDLTRLAMDAARFKGLDLVDTSMALGKVFSGNVQSAKRLGFVIDKNATSTQALAEIQKAAAGQADTYAKSAVGQAAIVQDKWKETQEKIGRGLSALQGVGTSVMGIVVDAVSGLIDKIGNLGSAFNDLHRLLDPALGVTQDMEAAIRKQAEALGVDADAAVAFYETQQKATEIAKQNAQALQDQAIAAEIAANPNETLYTVQQKLGVAMEDVIRVSNGIITPMTDSADATQRAANISQAAAGVVNQYAASVDASTAATDKQAAAAQAYHDRMVEMQLSLQDANTAQNIYNNTLGSGSQTLTNTVVRNYSAAWRAITGGAKKTRDETTTYLGQIPVFAARKFAGGLPLIKSAIAAYQLAITEPVSKAKQIATIQAELTSKNLQKNLKSHNPQIRADAQALVTWLKAKLAELNGTITITSRVVQGAPNYIGPGGQGSSGGNANPSASTMRFSLPPGGGASNNSQTVHHTFGPITVNGSGLSPEAAGALGAGIGDRLAGVVVELGRMRTLPIGRPA